MNCDFTLLLLYNYSLVPLFLLKNPLSHLLLHTSLNFSLSSGDKFIIFSLIFLSLKSLTLLPNLPWNPPKRILLKTKIPMACQNVIDFTPKISGSNRFQSHITIHVTPRKINGGQRIKKIQPFLCL